MKPSRRLLPLLFVTLFTLFAFVFAIGAEAQTGEQQKVLSEENAVSHAYHDDSSTAVHDALAILQRLKPPTRLVPLTRPKGFLSSAAYYAKELFYLLFMNSPSPSSLSSPKPQKLSPQLSKAVKLLEEAAAEGNADALFLLAEMNFYGNFTHPRNYLRAFEHYHNLASLTGNASAQHMVGFMYATGYGGAVKQDQAKAVLYHTFAAEGGDIRSEMTVAYRHHMGVSVPRDCETAVKHYKKVADKAIQYMRSGPPGGFQMIKESYRVADDNGGVFGEGASVSSSGANAKVGGPSSDAHAALEDVLEYLDLMSRKGDVKATFSLGKLHYEGARHLKRDVRLAKQYFLDVARRYWSKDGRVKSDVSIVEERIASKAAGFLGRMFLRGEGMPQSFEIARTWFKRGISNGDALSQYSMGLMHLEGLGMEKNPVKAAEYFAPAADQDLASAQVQLGILFLDQGDVETAFKYFDLAARNGHIEAFYYMAEMIYKGIGREKSCGEAAVYYKIVAEKAETILASFSEAYAAYLEGDLETALISYMLAAEQGFEAGQANVAYLLDQGRPKFRIFSLLPSIGRNARLAPDANLALIYWTRSARQHNIDSMVKMGDYYHYGLGTKADPEKAVACYQAAAETMLSAQAHWNLGWMHENGVGMEQDFHLAKRFYDQALETNAEAYLPVRLSLMKLRVRSWWNGISGGTVKGIKDDEVKKKWSFNEWIANFLESSDGYFDSYELDDYDSGDPMPGGDWDGGYDEIDEGIIDSLIILALAATLAFLVIYRQQRQLRNRRAQERQQQQQDQQAANAAPGGDEREQEHNGGREDGDGGLFPPPDDPNFNQWIAGGVGH